MGLSIGKKRLYIMQTNMTKEESIKMINVESGSYFRIGKCQCGEDVIHTPTVIPVGGRTFYMCRKGCNKDITYHIPEKIETWTN